MTAVARDALAVGLEGRLPTNQQYLVEHGVGAGTMQRALDELRATRALRTVSHGHLGRVITALDVAATWRAGGLDPIRLLLPPAGPVEITALEAVVAEALSRLGIPHTVRHRRGGSVRLAMARAGDGDLAVVSAGALSAADQGFRFRALGVGTYYGPDRIAVVSRRGGQTPPRLIAIDTDSPDHRALTLAEFPPDQVDRYVAVPFPHVPAAVLDERVDAGIWHITPSVVPLDLAGLELRGLATPAGRAAWQATSEAVLVAGSLRRELQAVLTGLDLTDLAERQDQAIAADSGLVAV